VSAITSSASNTNFAPSGGRSEIPGGEIGDRMTNAGVIGKSAKAIIVKIATRRRLGCSVTLSFTR
jgi:hypothetical protein